jgi:LPXTG-motif cell wall-anchored protein
VNPSRRGLLLSGRRSSRAAALTLGVLALGAVSAPAALAVQDTRGEPATALPAADAGAPRILTDSPVLGLGTTDEPARFGTGKVQLAVAPEVAPADGEPAPDMAGAQIRFTYTSAFGDSLEGAGVDGGFPTEVCTTDAAGDCFFDAPADPERRDLPVDGRTVLLFPGATFTVEQVEAPSSGAFTLPLGPDVVVHGTTEGDPAPDRELDLDITELESLPGDEAFDVAVEEVQEAAAEDAAPGPRNLAPTVDTDGEGITTVTFLDPAATLASAAPATTSPGAGGTAAAAATTSAGVTAAAGTGTAAGTTTAGAQLATTGTDTLPMLAAGAGLLLAGTGAVVLGRRRARSS